MEIDLYLEPIELPEFKNADSSQPRMGDLINIYTEKDNFPELEDIDLAIIGIGEDRKAVNNEGCALAPDAVRPYLYKLFPGDFQPRIADLGNIRKGFEVEDSYFALMTVVAELLKKKIIPIIIGGSQDLSFANYRAYEVLGQIINIVSVDSVFDLGNADEELNSHSFLSKIILHQPNFLFNYTNIGYQTHFVDQAATKLMNNLFFDVFRLGAVRDDREETEPFVRNADMMSVDISAVRASDAPGNGNAGPNGFLGEELCQIVRYAGLSDKLSSVGFYEANPIIDPSGRTVHLVAQMIWYFIDGFYHRKNEFPIRNQADYLKYVVALKEHKEDIVFFKSKKSDRWWMEVPCPNKEFSKYDRHYLVPCSLRDYQMACQEEVPDRWWQVYQKLM